MKAFNLQSLPYVGKRYTTNAVSLGSKRHGGELNLVSAPKGLGDGEEVILTTSSTGRPKIERGSDSTITSWLAKISSKNKVNSGVGQIYISKEDESYVKLIHKGIGFYNSSKVEGFVDLLLQVNTPPTLYSIPIIIFPSPNFVGALERFVYVFSLSEVVKMKMDTFLGLTDMPDPLFNPEEYKQYTIRS